MGLGFLAFFTILQPFKTVFPREHQIFQLKYKNVLTFQWQRHRRIVAIAAQQQKIKFYPWPSSFTWSKFNHWSVTSVKQITNWTTAQGGKVCLSFNLKILLDISNPKQSVNQKNPYSFNKKLYLVTDVFMWKHQRQRIQQHRQLLSLWPLRSPQAGQRSSRSWHVCWTNLLSDSSVFVPGVSVGVVFQWLYSRRSI